MSLEEWALETRKLSMNWSRRLTEAASDPKIVEIFWRERGAEWNELVEKQFGKAARKKLVGIKNKNLRSQILRAMVSIPDLTRGIEEKSGDPRGTADATLRIQATLDRLVRNIERLGRSYPKLKEAFSQEAKDDQIASTPSGGKAAGKPKWKKAKTLPPPLPKAAQEDARGKGDEAKKGADDGHRKAAQKADASLKKEKKEVKGQKGKPEKEDLQKKGARKATEGEEQAKPEGSPDKPTEEVEGEPSKSRKPGAKRRHLSVPADSAPEKDLESDVQNSGEPFPEEVVSDDQVLEELPVDARSEDSGSSQVPAAEEAPNRETSHPAGEAKEDQGSSPSPEGSPTAVEGEGAEDVEIQAVDLATDADVLDQPVIRLTKKSKGSGPKQVASGDKSSPKAPPQERDALEEEKEVPEGLPTGPVPSASATPDAVVQESAEESSPKKEEPVGEPIPIDISTATSKETEGGAGENQEAGERKTGAQKVDGTADGGAEPGYPRHPMRTHTGEDAKLALLELYLKSLRARDSLDEEDLLVLDEVVALLGSALSKDPQSLIQRISGLDRVYTNPDASPLQGALRAEREKELFSLSQLMRRTLMETWSKANPEGLELDLSAANSLDHASSLPAVQLERSLCEGLTRWRLPQRLSGLSGPAMSFRYTIKAQKGIPLTWPVPDNRLEFGLAAEPEGIYVQALHLIDPSDEAPLGLAATPGMPTSGVFFQVLLSPESTISDKENDENTDPGDKKEGALSKRAANSKLVRHFAISETSRFLIHLERCPYGNSRQAPV